MNAIRVVISGRVQGVGYRAWTVETASGLGLKGWVRNRRDGTVEAVFHGEADIILAMIESCKDGPLPARVDSIVQYAWETGIAEERFIAMPTV